MTTEEFQQIAITIPHQPGIYKYYDQEGVLLYVGKAKDLRKRTSSYFVKNYPNYKTRKLVQKIFGIEFTITDSEQDAFLLENALIKQYKPKYNIELKDDKSYPFIVLKKEPFPRVFLTRRKINDGSEYLGPFTSVGKVRELLNFIRMNIPLRNCKLNLSPANIKAKKFKVCLEYHLGNCKGPCEGLQSAEDYQESLIQIKHILKGNVSAVIKAFKGQMQDYAMNLQFERAEIMRKKIAHLESYNANSVVVGKLLSNVDVFSLLKEGEWAYVNYLMVQNGTIVQTHTIQLETHLEETDEEVLAFAIQQLRDSFGSLSEDIVVPFPMVFPIQNITITIPKAGDKKKLLDLSQKNVDYFRDEIRKKKMLQLDGKNEQQNMEVLLGLQEDLHLKELPLHIECFDNSNFQGSFPVSAMVCFKDGLPSKKDYRHYNVKTVSGINDFATMKEVVFRRYKRLKEERQPFPQLVIIDGGKGQLSAAMESIIALDLVGVMTVVGLAKNEEEIFYPNDSESLKLAYNGNSLKLIRFIRDEVHRFGIRFHRNQRSKGTFKNELEDIRGIGTATANQLLKIFRSVSNVQAASEDELSKIIGSAKAKLVVAYFSAKNNNSA